MIRNYGGACILACTLFALWEIAARLYNKKYIFPSPVQIGSRLWELKEVLLLHHFPATLWIVLVGLVISIVLGVGFAAWMNAHKAIERAFYPLLIASQTIPIIALAPIFILWFGYSIWSKVVVVVLITFFPITVSTFDGFRSTNRELVELMKTLGASAKFIFLNVNVPSALPYFFSGLKVAVTLSVIGAAIGEWLGAQAGLGYFSRRMMTQLDAAAVFAPIVLLAFMGIGFFLFVVAVEKAVLKWRRENG